MYCISTIYVDIDICVISQYWSYISSFLESVMEPWSVQTAATGNGCSACYITPHVTSSQIMSLSITHTSKTTVVLILDLLTVRSRLSSSITAGELYRCLRTWFSPLFTTPFSWPLCVLCYFWTNVCGFFSFGSSNFFLPFPASSHIPQSRQLSCLSPDLKCSRIIHSVCVVAALLNVYSSSSTHPEVLVIRFTFIQIAWKQRFPWGPSVAGMMLSAALRGNNVRDP